MYVCFGLNMYFGSQIALLIFPMSAGHVEELILYGTSCCLCYVFVDLFKWAGVTNVCINKLHGKWSCSVYLFKILTFIIRLTLPIMVTYMSWAFVFTVPADVPALNGIKPQAGAGWTLNIGVSSSNHFCFWWCWKCPFDWCIKRFRPSNQAGNSHIDMCSYFLIPCYNWDIGVVACASCQIRKIAGWACTGNAGNVFLHRSSAIPTCITARAWHTCRDAFWDR